jgi:acylphosphatase
MLGEGKGLQRRTVRVCITGRVQGVSYRAWTESNAHALGLNGWVRNRLDGTVEAQFSGPAYQVQEMLRRCRKGPPAAEVEDVIVVEECGTVPPSFSVFPTK